MRTLIVINLTIFVLMLVGGYYMKITKDRLVEALNVAKSGKTDADASKAELDSVKKDLAEVTAERDLLKENGDILSDPDVEALVDSILVKPEETVS